MLPAVTCPPPHSHTLPGESIHFLSYLECCHTQSIVVSRNRPQLGKRAWRGTKAQFGKTCKRQSLLCSSLRLAEQSCDSLTQQTLALLPCEHRLLLVLHAVLMQQSEWFTLWSASLLHLTLHGAGLASAEEEGWLTVQPFSVALWDGWCSSWCFY